uniref:Disease resistance N-terminal domain-containing protein n=1 Tax=Populus trichocarpa TaxID=3694 RepID=A0A2K1R6F5_POPTR
MAVENALACLKGAAGFLGQQFASVLPGFFTCGKPDKEKLKKLRETLNTVNGLLNDAEEKKITEAERDLFTVMVLKTWIADAKEAIYEAEDLLIETDNEAQRIDLVVGSQTGMYQLSKKTRHLSYARTRPEDLDNLVGLDEVQNLRTILLISKFILANMNDEEISDFLRRFQSLRVLSLLHVGKLPNSIGSLKQLWYINLS